MKELLKNSWKDILKDEMEKDYFRELEDFLKREYSEETVFPAKEELFRALNLTAYEDVKVVILGQDPYHGRGQATGLAFSVAKDMKLPPSLRNIYKELEDDLGLEPREDGDLTSWAEEGVLLLNTVLTVREKSPGSHRKQGWENFTDSIIKSLDQRQEPVIFVLWGNDAKAKEALIENQQHHIIKSSHPSPFSAYRGFLGSSPFSEINRILREEASGEISWK